MDQLTALEAAKQLMKKPGYVVLGFLPDTHQKVGDHVPDLANKFLDGYYLELTEPATVKDWHEQRKQLFGPSIKDMNNPKLLKKGHFWCAKLVKIKTAHAKDSTDKSHAGGQ